MLRIFAIVALCCAVSGMAVAVPATVDYIIDGDTFAARVMLNDGINISVRVRIANIDAPELHGNCQYEICLANRARERLTDLVPVGSVVELSDVDDDKYLGRIDAIVSSDLFSDIGAVLIAEKLARPYNGGRRMSWCE